jgi:pimeloyl-ACP methyl ester carboxylesterase
MDGGMAARRPFYSWRTCMPAQMTTWKTGDVNVRLFRAGSGIKLVFLHGAAGLQASGPFFETLARQYDVMAFEHPGFGKSDNPASIRNMADMAMYYLDVLDALDGAPCHLIGHSLGGWIAAEVAVRNSSRLASLTLLAPAGVRLKGVPIGDNFIWSPEETVRNLYHDASLAESVLAKTPSEEDAALALVNRYMAAKLAWEPRWFNPALARWLHRIKIPTLLMWGENDKLLPAAYASVWADHIPQLTRALIPHCGHLPHVEKADEVSRVILGFLNGR